MKKTLCISCFLLFIFSGFGQVLDTAAVVDTLTLMGQIDSLIKESNSLYKKGQYKEMDEIMENTVQLIVRNFGKENETYIRGLNYLATARKRLKKYEEAEKMYLEGIDLSQRVLGKSNKEYANFLQNLANLYMDTNRNSEAESLYLEARDIRENIFGNDHEEYAKSLYSLGYYYEKTDRYIESAQHYYESGVLHEKLLGKKNIEYKNSINNLANVYLKLGRYEDAKNIFIEILELYKNLYGKEHLEYSKGLNNLANSFYYQGDFSMAELLYLESRNIREKLIGNEHPLYGQALNNLANLYQKMGRFREAEKYYLEVLGIREKSMGKESTEYAKALNNLGILCLNDMRYEEAERYLINAKNIREKLLGKDHLDYAGSLENLGALYNFLNKFDESEKYMLECLSIREKKLGKDNVHYARLLNNLGSLYTWMERIEAAESSLFEALRIYEKTVGMQHVFYEMCLNDLIVLYLKTGQKDKAELMIIKAKLLLTEFLKRAIYHLSEQELAEYVLSKKKYIHRDNSYLVKFRLQWSPVSGINFDNILFLKELLLTFSNRVKNLSTADSTISKKLATFYTYNHLLSQEYSKPITERKNVTELEETANTLEKELIRNVAGLGEALRQVSWQEVQAALKPGEAALEFIHFNYYDPEPTDSVMYAALLLKPGMDQPLFILLFEEKQLKALLPAVDGKINNDQVNELYGVSSTDGKNALYHLLWSLLETQLTDTRTVYYSPSGLLHRLNLAALPADPQAVLSDRHNMVVLGSTRQLAIGNTGDTGNQAATALVYGGIQFDMDSTAYQPRNLNDTGAPRGLSFTQTDSTLRGDTWNYLKWSEKEVDNVRTALSQAGVDARIIKGWQATEESFKQIGHPESSGSPRILHISTHGYFFPDPQTVDDRRWTVDGTEPVFKLSDHPMIRSGLILAGANHAWKTGRPLGNREDGILTAYEISQMDLRNTELVVLSACETGLGHIEGNEGVYGLQRAFKIAGAKTIVMSLWQVPDLQTQELMTVFYQKLLLGKMPVRQALQAAQKEMRDEGYEPFYWAGFVVVE